MKQLVWDKIPTNEHGRSSEGSFLRAPDGSLLFAYSSYNTVNSDDGAPCDIALIRSEDEGNTWSEPRIIAKASDFGVSNIMSVSGLPLLDGRLCFFFLIKENNTDTNIGRAITSDGINFDILRSGGRYQTGYYVINNDRFIRLSDGRIAAPAAKHDIAYDTQGHPCFAGNGTAVVFISEDDGETFTLTGAEITANFTRGKSAGMQEPGLLEYPGGVMRLWARTEMGFQYECYSVDDMRSFTVPCPSEFTSPCSPMQMRRFEDGNVYCVYNPIPNYNGRKDPEGFFHGGRTPLVLRVSRDGGKTFGPLNTIEDDPNRGYCYPSVFETRDNALLIAYCRGGKEDKGCLNRLGIMKMSKNEID